MLMLLNFVVPTVTDILFYNTKNDLTTCLSDEIDSKPPSKPGDSDV